jgi:hypothetical protein
MQTSQGNAGAMERRETRTVIRSHPVWTALAVVAVLQGGGFALQRVFLTTAVRPLHHRLSELPLVLGPWTGRDLSLDPNAFPSVGAQEQSERLFTNSTGEAVFVHCAAWMSQDDWTPHIPELCYTGNGWELVQARALTLAGRADAPMVIQHYQEGSHRVAVGYWYQFEKSTYVDRDGGRKLLRSQWGRRDWPPLLKTLLQTDDTEGAEQRLLDLATRLYEWNCAL